MIKVALYILFFGVWFLLNNKKHGFNSSSLLIFVYFISSCCHFVLNLINYDNQYAFERVYLDAVIYHIFTTWIFISPIIIHGNRLDIESLKISEKRLNRISIAFILIGALTMILSIPGIISVLSFDSFEGARQDAIWGENDNSFYSYGLIGYIATIGMITPMFVLFLAFYRLFCLHKPDIVFYLLMLTSLSGTFMNLTIAGRDGLVRWFMFIIFNIIIFKKQFSLKLIPFFIKISFVIIFSISVFFFTIITFSRFGEGSDALLSIVDYLGMSEYWFSEVYKGVGAECLFGFSSIFPIIPDGANSLEIAKMSLNFSTSSFHTFVGSFVLRVGTIWTIVMGGVFNLIYRHSHVKTNNYLHNFFCYMIFYQIVYIGIFYFVFALLAWQCSFLIIYVLSLKFSFNARRYSPHLKARPLLLK